MILMKSLVLLGRAMSSTITGPISVVMWASWNSVIELLDWFKYQLIAVVTEGKKSARDKTALCLSVVRKIVSVVLLII